MRCYFGRENLTRRSGVQESGLPSTGTSEPSNLFRVLADDQTGSGADVSVSFWLCALNTSASHEGSCHNLFPSRPKCLLQSATTTVRTFAPAAGMGVFVL
jgi:hypothetical protein